MMFMKFLFAFVTSIVVGVDVGLDVTGATSIKVVSTEAVTPFDTPFDIEDDSINITITAATYSLNMFIT